MHQSTIFVPSIKHQIINTSANYSASIIVKKYIKNNIIRKTALALLEPILILKYIGLHKNAMLVISVLLLL
jgi:hypothetical protein